MLGSAATQCQQEQRRRRKERRGKQVLAKSAVKIERRVMPVRFNGKEKEKKEQQAVEKLLRC